MPKQQLKLDSLPDIALAEVALTHGQVIRLLTDLGFANGVKRSTFNYYVKSLRKLGVPFDAPAERPSARRRIIYGFDDLMELALALLLRVYGILPDAVVVGLQKFRGELRPIYHQAYKDIHSAHYANAFLVMAGAKRRSFGGLYLDLNLRYSGGQLIEFGPPRTLSPFEALCLYAQSESPARSYLPINLSSIAGMIVGQCQRIPTVRRGRTRRHG
ncbi:hypothetical protein BA190_08475 [Labrys sp. WJW]|uniref:hypothetical protein n=1 Tax=Labrys sp. WJW TaxID=1737983 RepID=UPI000833361D|nr:hypothetical protein [Labrys sp. WJW]OCC05446.1 hypothetical protein BA190_08475 [Labrys sp. WJW]